MSSHHSADDSHLTPEDNDHASRILSSAIAEATQVAEAAGWGRFGHFHQERDDQGHVWVTWSLEEGGPRFLTCGTVVIVPCTEPAHWAIRERLGVAEPFRASFLPLALTKWHVLGWLQHAECRITNRPRVRVSDPLLCDDDPPNNSSPPPTS
jgi:hypothetical protein